ncbi:glycoside hydrolase family 16 protein [Rhizopogon vinicolor AM-OR11-026]|uniref:Glycoside hydrolase family 16 protein n=1 Tax=Rhizopogon vinicolor AM-OR11-026 TaxID=1314800 RepID=A0A1B7MUF3_9AGAM|nr:glycoside hydrolase family 16 protein [Rhizopogon vinicolor AM-OR11-026]
MRTNFLAFVIFACTVDRTFGATYRRTSQLTGQSFLDAFHFDAIPDPTNGRVTYVDESTAISDGLVSVDNNQLTLRADYTTQLSPSDPGRNSFRIVSNAQYSTHVAIFDIAHMPQGCGTWPAVCEVGANWPYEGEVDILEGVNDEPPNACTLHTGSNCQMPASRPMTGTAAGNNCDAYATGNEGCGVTINDNKSYGPEFNNNGGGWYAIERSSSYIKIFFWERTSGFVPSDITSPGSSIDTSTWGTPAAYFPDTDCDFPSHFGPHNIVINLTFCGDWAGSVYPWSGCPSTCVDYVNDNPSAFDNAYFEFNSLNIYQ